MLKQAFTFVFVAAALASCGSEHHAASPTEPPSAPQSTTESSPPQEVAASDDAVLDEETLDQLEAIGYMAEAAESPADVGVILHDETLAQPGYNLLTSGHAPAAFLTDMDGEILHRWSYDASDLYPVRKSRDYWRRIHLMPDGTLFALVDPHGLLKLTRDSKLVWHTDGRHLLHHDFFIDESGAIYAIGKKIGLIADVDAERKLIDDTIVVLDSEGKHVKTVSIFEAFRGTEWFDQILERLRAIEPFVEVFHTNTIEVFDGSLEHISPFLKKGNIVLCSPIHQNVFIIDMDMGKVVWNWFGPWERGIRQPTFLSNGNWLLFDNAMYFNDPKDAASQVIEYTFPGKDVVWKYEGDPDSGDFYSRFSSLADRLPNGNTLITVSDEGRAIEVTPEKKVAWEFQNPFHMSEEKAEKSGAEASKVKKVVGTLFQVERVPTEAHDRWLQSTR